MIDLRADRPWLTALEMQFKLASDLSRALTILNGPPHTDALATLDRIKRADTFSWSTDTTEAAYIASKSINTDSVLSLSDLPCESGWWWFDTPVPIQTTKIDQYKTISGLLWGLQDDGRLIVESIVSLSGCPVPGLALFWKFNTSLSDFVSGAKWQRATQDELPQGRVESHPDADEKIARLCLACFAWLRQRILVTSQGEIERHLRKRIAREHGIVSEGVKVVQLRRIESASEHYDESVEQHWTCRWIVNGHWRNQPFKNGHKLIYIMPYLKGPADKPLRVHKTTVYAVTR